MKNLTVKEVVLTSLGIALVFLTTYLIKIPNGIHGYLNLGDGCILLFASLVNPFLAFLIGGIGSCLADIVGGYGIYAIPTLIIKGIEGCMVAYAIHKFLGKANLFIYGIAGLWMVLGYFLTDAFINQSFAVALAGTPVNIIQAIAGVLIAHLASPIVKRHRHQE